jgi:hypothetical protein
VVVILIISIITILILTSLVKLTSKFNKVNVCFNYTLTFFKYNFFIRLGVETFLIVLLSIFIGFKHFGTTEIEKIGQYVSYLFMVIYLSMIPWSIRLL